MTTESAPPFFVDTPASPDRDNPIFDFKTSQWLNPPQLPNMNDNGVQFRTSRPFFLEEYRTFTEWHRYQILGYFAYEALSPQDRVAQFHVPSGSLAGYTSAVK
jgi:hypothetical protein